MAERFSRGIGSYAYTEYDIAAMSDAELAQEIRSLDFWDTDLLRDLCWRADLIDEWEEADGDNFEYIAYKAAEKLGVEID